MAMMSKLKNPAMSLMTELQLRTDFHLLLLSLILGELLLTVYGIPMDAGASYRSTPVHQHSVICVMCVADSAGSLAGICASPPDLSTPASVNIIICNVIQYDNRTIWVDYMQFAYH